MALSIYQGHAQSNRIEMIYDALLHASYMHPENTYIMLVPEQNSLSVQEALVKRHKNHALSNIDILTFNRLSHKVFADIHENEKTVISENGKLMMIRLLLAQKEEQLSVLRRSIRHEGVVQELKSIFSEFAEYNITPNQLEESLSKMEGRTMFKEKMKDIAMLYRNYLDMIHEHYELSEERTSHLAAVFSKWGKAKNTIIALDGYTGFTPPQYQAVIAFMQNCKDVLVGVTLGSQIDIETQKEEDAPFFMTAHLVERLQEIAIRNGISVETIQAEDNASCFQEEIRHIEKTLYRYNKETMSGQPEHIRLYKTADSETEVRLVVQEILKGIREEVRFRDMAVICGNPEEYQSILEAAFENAGIPYFFDINHSLRQNPYILFLEGLQQIVTRNFDYESVFMLAKNPLVLAYLGTKLSLTDGYSVSERMMEMENYVRFRGIRGISSYEKNFENGYKVEEGRLDAINEVRESALDPFINFYHSLKGAQTVSEKVDCLQNLLIEMKVHETLIQMAEEFAETFLEKSKEYQKIEELVQNIFDEMKEIFADASLSEDTFFETLLSGIDNISLGIAPPTKDRVVVGDVKRTRLNDIKRLYVIGANEGQFPGIANSGGLLTDLEKEELQKQNIFLSETAKQELFYAQFYLYLLLTKPTESLTISYANAGFDGKVKAPSAVLGQIKTIFPDIQIQNIGFGRKIQNTEEEVLKNYAKELHAKRFEDVLSNLATVYAWAEQDESLKKRMDDIEDGFTWMYQAVELNRQTANEIFGRYLNGSVTRLEKYALCPYAHFLQYGLNIEERAEHEIQRADIGSFFHACIDRFFKILLEENRPFGKLTEEERECYSKDAVIQVAMDEKRAIFKENKRNLYLIQRTTRVLNRTTWALQEQWKKGKFDAIETEVSFGHNADAEMIKENLKDGGVLSLEGTIDRIDTYTSGDKSFVKVLDYKSSEKHLEAEQIYAGVQLQLLLYLKAAMKRQGRKFPDKEIVPVGAYYYHIDDPLVKESEKDPKEDILKELRIKGITENSEETLNALDSEFNHAHPFTSASVLGLRTKKNGQYYETAKVFSAQQLKEMTDFALEKAKDLANGIMNGEISAFPVLADKVDGCQYCSYQGICGFDEKIPGYKRNQVEKKNFEDLLGEQNGGMDA